MQCSFIIQIKLKWNELFVSTVFKLIPNRLDLFKINSFQTDSQFCFYPLWSRYTVLHWFNVPKSQRHCLSTKILLSSIGMAAHFGRWLTEWQIDLAVGNIIFDFCIYKNYANVDWNQNRKTAIGECLFQFRINSDGHGHMGLSARLRCCFFRTFNVSHMSVSLCVSITKCAVHNHNGTCTHTPTLKRRVLVRRVHILITALCPSM